MVRSGKADSKTGRPQSRDLVDFPGASSECQQVRKPRLGVESGGLLHPEMTSVAVKITLKGLVCEAHFKQACHFLSTSFVTEWLLFVRQSLGCTGPWNFPSLRDGIYTCVMVRRFGQGNTNSTSATFRSQPSCYQPVSHQGRESKNPEIVSLGA